MKIEFVDSYMANLKEAMVVIFSSKTIGKLEKIPLLKGINTKELFENFDFKLDKASIISLKNTSGFKKLVLATLGKDEEVSAKDIRNLSGKISCAIATEETIIVQSLYENSAINIAENIYLGFKLKSWSFDKYISDNDHKATYKIKTIKILGKEENIINGNALAEGVNLTRELSSEPANVLYPKSFVERINELKILGLEVEILDKKKMEALKMGSLLSVSLGSDKEPYVAIIKYSGGSKGKAPIAFVGKGVTFDTGGYSLKPALGMIGMKKDMTGAGVVVGLMKTLALRKAKVNAIGVVGLVENMVNGSATKPGDIVKAMSGKTIEVLNTDAEGRMVLADILWYTQTTYKPEIMINLATLTGAMIVALGNERAGMFSNDDTLANNLKNVADETGELLWQMPLGEEYSKYLKSSVADLQNISLTPNPGSIFAAMFLKEFVGETKWAHLDIAGVADTPVAIPTIRKGARGYGVILLDTLIKKHYEG